MIVVTGAITECGGWGDWSMDSSRWGLVSRRRSGGRRKLVECTGMGRRMRMGRAGGKIVDRSRNKASQDKPSRVGRWESVTWRIKQQEKGASLCESASV